VTLQTEFAAAPSIGRISIWPPVILAPMAGVTDVPFRSLCRSFMEEGLSDNSNDSDKSSHVPGLFVNQMITARAFVEENKKTMKLAEFGKDESPRSIQLYGTEPASLKKAVEKLLVTGQVEHIDLNFGCPVPKVTKHGGGGALPYKQSLFRKIIKSVIVSANGEIPITVKFRMGINSDHLTYLEAGKIAEGEGASAISLHARTVEQLYSGDADWSAIGKLKEHVTTIPIFGNGDIWEAHDAVHMMQESNADGVVIGRGCLGRPWLFKQLAEIFSGKEISQFPSLGEVGRTMLRHAEAVVEWNGSETALRTFRKHASWYLTGFAVGKDARREIQQITSLQDLANIIDNFDGRQQLPIDSYRIPRSHTGGPKNVSLPDGWLNDPYEDFELNELAGQFASGG
jgi:nifR3 family TIM-barrel protein